MTPNFIHQFSAQLDKLLGIAAKESNTTDQHVDAALEIASLLAEMNFDAELAPRADIRSRWIRQTQKLNRSSSPGYFTMLHWKWVVTFIVIILLAVFYKPVFAAVSRALGYVYVPDVGFVARDSALLMKQPVFQEHEGQTITVTHGVATVKGLTLFLEFNDVARPVDGAWLETSSGQRLELSYWEYYPNVIDSHGIKMIFPPLPTGIQETTLSLPEGWHLPLEWILASQSNLPDVRAVPFDSGASATPTSDLCTGKNSMNVCVLAATTSEEKTSVLIQAQSSNPELIAGDIWQGLVWQIESQPVKLVDRSGNIFLMDREEGGTLTFPPVAGDQKVHLVIPSVLASVDIPDQNLIVDVGDNPQPDTIIPLDINIQVLDASVHFSQATFVGDDVNSLRLLLNADEPIQTVDGITPASLEIGKPDKVDDLYGNGMLAGSKDIFVELLRPTGKITGVISIPILRATAIVEGPFEFDLNLKETTSASSAIPTPAESDPNLFSPVPTPTALPLDSYFFSGQTLEDGDLLYAVWDGRESNVYRYAPSTDIDYGLFLTLPGHVSSINIHPDRQGLDYLTGIYNKDTNEVDDPHLYTLRFAEPSPRLLTLTPHGVMIPFQLAWSQNGQLLAFNTAASAPAAMGSIGWVDLTCRESGECPVHILNDPTGNGLGLSDTAFSPDGKWLAFNGSDSVSGASEVYLLPFEDQHPGELFNLSESPFYGDGEYSWISDDTLVWMCETGDLTHTTRSLCLQKVTEQSSSRETIFSFDDWQYFGMALNGEHFWQVVINRQAEREQQIWLYDRLGSSTLLTAAPLFNLDYGKPEFSKGGQYLAYTSTIDSFKTVPDTLYLINTISGQRLITYKLDKPVGWLGWVH
jgi:hypothetical protein